MTRSFRAITCFVILVATLILVNGCNDRAVSPIAGEDDDVEARIARVADSLQQPLVIEGQAIETWNIEERMKRFSVPGVSVAVIDQGELAWARAWGVIENGIDDPVTTETIFQAGSVSKPVTALLALILVGDGKLELDKPINEVLRTWKVPENEFTRRQPVTLRHVMAHQAGFTPFGYLIPRDESKVPSMAELLAGGIRDWPAIRVEFVPGSRRAYSNAGYCVLQLILEETSGLSLHQLATREIFAPLEMSHSTFDEPLSPELLETAACGHSRNRTSEGDSHEAVPVEGKAEIAPGAAGGLWSTPTDLARVAIEVMDGWRGERSRLISPAIARDFLTPQAENQGLGIYLVGEGPAFRALHKGGFVGFVCLYVFYPNTGQGAVLMSNSAGGRWLQPELLAAIAQEYQWPNYPVRRTLGQATTEQLQELVGVYSLDPSPNITLSVKIEDGAAIGQINENPPFELEPTTESDLFVLPRESLEFLFQRGEDGEISKVTLRKSGDSGHSYSRL